MKKIIPKCNWLLPHQHQSTSSRRCCWEPPAPQPMVDADFCCPTTGYFLLVFVFFLISYPFCSQLSLTFKTAPAGKGSLSSLLSALHSALIQPLALPCRTAVGNKTVYIPLLCPFAGQSVIALRTVNRIKLKQSSSLSHSLSLPPCYSNAICGIIMKKSQRKN